MINGFEVLQKFLTGKDKICPWPLCVGLTIWVPIYLEKIMLQVGGRE
jgi:hypothetical protein